jgi:hypothetical protein
VITSLAECEKAAVALNLKNEGGTEIISQSSYQGGCTYYGTYEQLYWNTQEKKYWGEWELESRMLCQRNLDGIAKNSAALMRTFGWFEGFEEVTTGTCVGANKRVITTIIECEEAAAALGWGDTHTDADVFDNGSDQAPAGCYMNIGASLMYNTKLSSTYPVSIYSVLACKRQSLVSVIQSL